MNKKQVLTFFIATIAILLIFSGCRLLFPWAFPSAADILEDNRTALEEIHAGGDTVIEAELVAFSEAFMQTFAVENSDSVASWEAGATTLPGAGRRANAMATVPVDQTST